MSVEERNLIAYLTVIGSEITPLRLEQMGAFRLKMMLSLTREEVRAQQFLQESQPACPRKT